MSAGIACSPLYSTTRLNGMPIQTFAMITLVSAQDGEVSQLTGSMPTPLSSELITPESLFIIQLQVEELTIKGSSHGTRNSARSVAESRKFWAENTASAMPIVSWNSSETPVNTTVCVSAGQNVGLPITAR